MQHLSPARQRFARLIRQPDPLVPLAEAALAVAWEDQGGADSRPSLRQLATFAASASTRLTGTGDPTARALALSTHLFEDLGFYGDPSCYKHPDPANSYLDRVLERRTGLPIMLALIYLEVGWRLGLPVHGLALPGHFLVRITDPEGDRFLDPFTGGTPWSATDCERQIALFYGETSARLIAMIMAPPGRGAILARILRNLKQTHLAREDTGLALAAVERLLMLDTSDPGELRDRGLLRLRVGRIHAALEDLEQYARRNPAASDLPQIRNIAREMVSRVAPQN